MLKNYNSTWHRFVVNIACGWLSQDGRPLDPH